MQYLYGGLRLQPKGDRATTAAQAQLSLLIGLFILLKAVSYWFDRFALATQSQQLVAGFTGLKYTDVYAVLPALNILAAISVLVAALFFVNVFRRHWVIPVIGAGLLVLTSVVVGHPVPADRPAVPGAAQRARPRAAVHRAQHQRHARGVRHRRLRGHRLPGHGLAADDGGARRERGHPQRHPPARPGRRVADVQPAAADPRLLLVQQQARRRPLRPAGRPQRGAIVAVREINLAGIPDGQRNWTNDRTVYTHGYGVVAAYDNTALSNGQPDFFESDIPSVGRARDRPAARLLRRAEPGLQHRRRARGLAAGRARLPGRRQPDGAEDQHLHRHGRRPDGLAVRQAAVRHQVPGHQHPAVRPGQPGVAHPVGPRPADPRREGRAVADPRPGPVPRRGRRRASSGSSTATPCRTSTRTAAASA